MAQQSGPGVAIEIGRKAEELRLLAASDEGVPIERLREETATLQALLAEAARLQLRERRFAARGTAVLSPVLIQSSEFTGYCLVSDLSAEGMKARAYAAFSREQPVCVHFTSQALVEGRLVWSESGRLGVRFDDRIDVAKVLASIGRGGVPKGRDRPARLQVQCLAEVSMGRRFGIAEVQDVSPYGLKVLTRLAGVGEQVAVQVGELEERIATVRWTRAGSAGLAFARQLSFHELAQVG